MRCVHGFVPWTGWNDPAGVTASAALTLAGVVPGF